MTEDDAKAPPGDARADRPSGGQPVRHEVKDILKGAREAILVHDGQDYRLRITARGKLILTK